MIHVWGRDAGSEALAIRISRAHGFGHGIPITCQQRRAHITGRLANTLEDLKQILIAIDVAFEALPVVDSRKPRLARVADYESTLQLSFVNRQMLALNALGPKVNTG